MAAETTDNFIQTFDPVVFPMLLFVAIGGDREQIANSLKDYDGDPFYVNPKDLETSDALTYANCENSDGRYGTLVWLHTPSKVTVKIVAHEAVHAALAIMQQCGIRPDANNDETQAYLVGFCADCIWKTYHNQSSD